MRSWRSKAVAGTTAAIMILTANIAFADIADNNALDSTGNTSIVSGGSTTIRYWIQGQGGDGGPQGDHQGNCNARSASPTTVAISVPGGVTATPASLTFTGCGDANDGYQSVVFSSSAPGSHAITHVVTDTSTGSTSNSANFTLQVTAAVPSDTTPPVITPTVTGTKGSNDWYTSDVDLSWDVQDAQSTVASQSGCGSVSITTDQNATTYTCSATSAGGTASESVTIKRDATPPLISGADVNDTTWRNTSLSQVFTVTDTTSGLATASDSSFTLTATAQSADGSTPTTVSKTVTDNAGNSATRSLSALIDLTEPEVALNGPSDGASYVFGSVPTASCVASDGLSGLNGTCSVTTSGSAVGTQTATATATDHAGNTESVTVEYQVLAWTIDGFKRPVDASTATAPLYNTVKGGSTVPLKFEIFAGATELTNTSAATVTFAKVGCASNADEDPLTAVTTGGTSYRYDSVEGQFIYNWQTPKQAGACYRATATANDGSTTTAFFKLK